MTATDMQYFEPTDVRGACSILSEFGDRAKLIAGGQSLLILLKHRLISPQALVSIRDLAELDYLSCDTDGTLRIGAATTHRTLETSPLVARTHPVISTMARRIGAVQIRNAGSIAGNLCHADPGADPPPVFLALEARVRAMSERGSREIPLTDFFKGYYETALEADEIMTEIVVPPLPLAFFTSYDKFTMRDGDMGIASVAVVVPLTDGVCGQARIAVGSVGPIPVRIPEAEEVLIGKGLDSEVIDRAATAASENVEAVDDMSGSAEYKRELVRVLLRRALVKAIANGRRGV